MKKVEKVLWAVLLFAVPWGVVGQSYAKRDIIKPVSCFVDPVSYDKSTGQLILDLSIEWHFFVPDLTTCEVVTVHATGVDGLEYSGPERWEVQPDTLTPDFSTRLQVMAPPNDTSGLSVVIECGKYQHKSPRYFITTADTLQVLASNPREWPKMPTEKENRQNRLKDYERAKREWEEEQERLKHVGKSITGHLPRGSTDDSAFERPPSREMTLDSLHKLEETPLTELSGQFVQVGETLYVRREGEYKFKPAETYSSREEAVQARKNREPDWSREDHIVMDLRKQEDYDFVKKFVDSLIPMEKEGYFHTVTTIDVTDKVRARRIEYAPYPSYPGQSGPPPKPGREEKESPRKDRCCVRLY